MDYIYKNEYYAYSYKIEWIVCIARSSKRSFYARNGYFFCSMSELLQILVL